MFKKGTMWIYYPTRDPDNYQGFVIKGKEGYQALIAEPSSFSPSKGSISIPSTLPREFTRGQLYHNQRVIGSRPTLEEAKALVEDYV